MPSTISYQELLADTIKDFVIHKKLTIEEIMTQVIESIMLAEREVFLAQASDNKGNGYYPRFMNTFQGKFHLQVPRDRQGVFQPLLLELIKQDSERMHDLALALYSQGVSHRGVKTIFEDIFHTQMSPSKVSQLVKAFEPHRLAWQARELDTAYHAVLIDALHQPIRRETVACEAMYLVMGLKHDFTREILGIYQLPQESASGWKTVFADLTARGIQHVGLLLSDELSGIEEAAASSFPHRHHQLCGVHKVRALLTRARHQDKVQVAARDGVGCA